MPFAGNIGPGELIVVLVIALLVIGPKKLPEVGRSLGHGHARVQGLDQRRQPRRRRRATSTAAPPGQVALRISRQLLDDIVEHARAEAPKECCGMIASRDGEAVAVHRARNAANSALQVRDGPDGAVQIYGRRSRTRGSTSARSTTRTRARTRSRRETDINLAQLGDTDDARVPGHAVPDRRRQGPRARPAPVVDRRQRRRAGRARGDG